MKNTPLVVFLGSVLLSSCGGGSSSGGGTTPTPTQPEPVGFQSGVFDSSNDFAGMCESPRTGINSDTGVAYVDVQGTTTNENQWLRSWSNELYLWYNEINDQDPALFSDPLVYFDSLKTIATTPSGSNRDQFHFTYDTAEWIALSEAGVSSGYGLSIEITNSVPPREAIISFVEPTSPAQTAGFARGSTILTVDGADFVNGNTQAIVDTLNAGLFPADDNETHLFTIRNPDGSVSNNVSITSGPVTSTPVPTTEVISTATGNVGYLVFNEHIATAEAQLIEAVEELDAANITDLVLDLRYNGGGYLAIAAQVAYMIAGPAASNGRVFELQEFNDKHQITNPITGNPIRALPFIDESIGFSATAGEALPSLELNRVFVITGDSTCSASEAIINGLRGINVEVILIGATTCGKPYGFYPEDNCGTTYFSIQFSGENDIGFSAYPDGFSPQNSLGVMGVPIAGCAVLDDLSVALGNTSEARLAAALEYRLSASCPTPPPVAVNISSSGFSIQNPEITGFTNEIKVPLPQSSFLRQNRILEMP